MLAKIFQEKCPYCDKSLVAENHEANVSSKSCPDGHYRKEIHPYLETVVEYHQEG